MANGIRQTSSGVVLTATGVAETVTATVIDSFERASLDHYTGDTGAFDITSTFATDGSNGLEADDTVTRRIVSTSGLDNYPSKPAEFKYDLESNRSTSDVTGTLELSPAWGAADTDNFYMAQVRIDNPGLRLFVKDGGSFSTFDGGGTDLSEWNANTAYTMTVQWDDGSTFGGSDNDMTVDITDPDGNSIGSNSGNDSTHATNDGVGERTSTPNASDRVNSDFWRITG